MKKPLFASLSLLTFLAGCEAADPQLSVAERSNPIAGLTSMEFARVPDAEPSQIMAASREALLATLRVASEAQDWQDAHRKAQDAITGAEPGLNQSAVDQALSRLVLSQYLVPNKDEEGVADLALTYAKRLVEQQSPEAEALLEATGTFSSVWSAAEVRVVALGAAEAAEAHAAGATACRDCQLPESLQESLSEAGRSQEVTQTRRRRAAEQLRALAQ